MIHKKHITISLLTIPLSLALLLNGCVERSEKIKVRPDGQISTTITITADKPSELAPGRVPSPLSGWTVHQNPSPDGKKNVLTADQTFPSAKSIPSSDATPGDLLATTYVQSPTTLKIEKRSDATYYQFRRVYSPRPLAWLAYLDDRPGKESLQVVSDKPTDKVTPEEWQRAITFGIQTLALKKLQQARAAITQITPQLPQDKWLTVHQTVLNSTSQLDFTKLIKILTAPNQPDIVQEIQAIEAKLDQSLLDAIIAAGLDNTRLIRFKGLMNQYKSEEAATKDAQATTYKITVELPGESVGSNASQSNANTFTWEFKGNAFCDRELELLATTKVK